MKKMLIIGIAGGSGSGKSTVAKLIEEEFKGDVHSSVMTTITKPSTTKPMKKEQSRIMTVLTHSIRNLCPSISRR